MKKFWQHFKTWQKALIFLFFIFLFIFHTVFLCSVNFLAKENRVCKDTNVLKDINIFKKESVIKDGDLEIATNKTEYKQGEEVKVILKNNLGQEIFLYGISAVTNTPNYYYEKKDSDEMIETDVRLDINCEYLKECRHIMSIMPKEEKEFIWDQKDDHGNQAKEGIYKLSATLGVWNKSALIYSNEFTISSAIKDGAECKENSECQAKFSNCNCGYRCQNKNEETKDCVVECIMTSVEKPECICSENKCVEANNCNKLKSEINEMIKDTQYCESDSDCMLDETNHLNCPFGTYLITGIYNSDKNIIVSSIQNKIEEYNNTCEACEYEMLPAPTPKDIKCQNNQCVDARYSS